MNGNTFPLHASKVKETNLIIKKILVFIGSSVGKLRKCEDEKVNHHHDLTKPQC